MKSYQTPTIYIMVFETEDILTVSSPVKISNLSKAYQGEAGYDIENRGFELDWDTLYR